MNGGAVGTPAKEMLGRTPDSIDAVRPIRAGVLADFDMTEALFAALLRRAVGGRKLLSPRVLLAVPTGITRVEKRAMLDATERAGARKVYLIDEARAAGLGAGVPIHEARAHMIVDIGGGTSQVTVMSLADIVVSTRLPVAGETLDDAVVHHVKKNYNILLGSNLAEEIRIRLGSACPLGKETTHRAWGRDLIAGLPREITLGSEEVREALSGPIRLILDAIRNTLEKTGPEFAGDLMERGILLCGGGVLTPGLPEVIEEETGLPVRVADAPRTTVAEGLAAFLEGLDEFKHILETSDEDI
jgi:rod shape-determining protein MreB